MNGAVEVLPGALRVPSVSPSQAGPSKAETAFVVLPWWVWLTTGLLAIWGCFSANPTLTPAAIVVVAVSIQLLWRRGEPPVLVFACAMQWLQASAIIFYTNSYGLSLEEAGGGPEFEEATWLSLLAVAALALGMRVALVRCRHSQYPRLRAEALRVNIANAFIAYLICFVVSTVAGRIAFAYAGLAQLIYALTTLKWMAVFVLGFASMEQRRGYVFIAAAVAVELGVGLLGFFAGFKSVFFVVLIVALTSPFALKGKRLALSAAVIATVFVFGVIWSSIKGQYREFLNQGSGQQEVVVSVEESATKLTDLVTNFTWDNFTDGLETMILRIGYVKFFALTLANVPDNVPYERGALWFGAVKHVLTPRLFFPEKEAISDSDRTMLYSGVRVASAEQGTSIGIGYVAESYVDFGPRWMFAPIFLLGLFYGLIYRVFVVRARFKLLCTAIASAILIFGAYAIETSNIKIVGGNVTVILVMTALYFVFRRPFQAWLEQRSHGDELLKA
ncbi:MAG TPA: hypothetical protein VIV62_01715 [Chthoniobacterales bacterium]|jgi:hypothetical protein